MALAAPGRRGGAPLTTNVLVVNTGSATAKLALFPAGEPLAASWRGHVDWGGATGRLRVESGGEHHEVDLGNGDRADLLAAAIGSTWDGPGPALGGPDDIAAVGHRVVHGGPDLVEPAAVDTDVRVAIEAAATVAPLHNHAALDGIDVVDRLLPGVPQLAVFDSAFHATLPAEASTYPGPRDWVERGFRRIGFHGTSHEDAWLRTVELLGTDTLRLVNCHLGGGASLAAIRDGRSIDTTMGFTPLEGLMMATRSGTVDPGLLLHLLRHDGVTPDELDDLLHHRSGLLGLSGVSGDIRQVEVAADDGNEAARLALGVYAHRVRSGIGAMAASLGGIDAISFTGGVGENDARIRNAALDGLGFLGVDLDHHANQAARPDTDVASPTSRVRILVVAIDEEATIGRAVLARLHS